MAKIGMISLGCPKNQVDAEVILKTLQDGGHTVTGNEAEADVIIINTCGFIEDAKAEAIENILEAAKHKQDGDCKAIIVTGCLAERYKDEISDDIPEVDVVVGIGSNKDILSIVNEALNGNFENKYGDKADLPFSDNRLLTTPSYTAYLKIAEGCNNRCTYCAIPQIRGNYRSRAFDDCVNEAKSLAEKGVTEVVLIAQDTTMYGTDISEDGRSLLPELLEEISEIDGIKWIRTLYTYPEEITDRLIEVIKNNKKVVNYLDIPLQHCDNNILKLMNRRGTKEDITALIKKLRDEIPNIIIRTTLITGFPGETEEDFTELCEFVKESRFDRLGCFAYSEEENTPAEKLPGMVDKQVRVDRSENIMEMQLTIAQEKNEQKMDKTYTVLTEGYDDYIRCYYGRSYMDAPEIDGKIFFISDKPLKIGEYVKVKIFDTIDYDLLGELEEE